MKKSGKIRRTVLYLLLLALLSVQVSAAVDIDVNRNTTMTISYQNNGKPLVGAQFELYRVADVDAKGVFTLAEPFTQYPVRINGLDASGLRDLASTLDGYIQKDKLQPLDTGKTDAQGKLKFPNQKTSLKTGLYLIRGGRLTQNGYVYTAQPTMVILPGQDAQNGSWIYDVTVNAKHESVPENGSGSEPVSVKVLKVWNDQGHQSQRPAEIIVQLLCNGVVYDTVTLNATNNWRYTWENLDPTCTWVVVEIPVTGYTVTVTQEGITYVVTNTYGGNTPSNPNNPSTPNTPNTPSTPNNPTLPQTGQLWWPVPVLLAAGLLLVLIGLIRRRGASA